MSVRTNAGFLDSVPVGAIMIWSTNTAPDKWVLCRGQAISREDYSELFAVIGTTYGVGDGTTTFNVPDYRDSAPVGKNDSGTFSTLGDKVGSETITQTVSQMPSHSHTIQDPGHSHTYAFTSGQPVNHYDQFINQPGIESLSYENQNTWGATTGISINETGGGQPMSIVQPSLVSNFIIKAK